MNIDGVELPETSKLMIQEMCHENQIDTFVSIITLISLGWFLYKSNPQAVSKMISQVIEDVE